MASEEGDILRVMHQLRTGVRANGSNETVTHAVFRLRQAVADKKAHLNNLADALRRELDNYERERDAYRRGMQLVAQRLQEQDDADTTEAVGAQAVTESVRRRGMDLGVIKE